RPASTSSSEWSLGWSRTYKAVLCSAMHDRLARSRRTCQLHSPEMPTVGERLATIEAALIEVRDDVKQLRDVIEGGNGVTWERSMRGRLHHIESSLSAFLLRRSVGLGVLKGWQAAILLVCAVGTLA